MNETDRSYLQDLTTFLHTASSRGFEQAAAKIPVIPETLSPHVAELALTAATFIAQSLETHRYYLRIAEGDLTPSIPRHLYMAMPAKAIQADLKHLTWQTRCIADGDLKQKVRFLGEFSSAFNSLIDALRDKRRLEQEVRANAQHLEKMNAILKEQANTDSLTGLRNRQYFDRALDKEIERSQRYQTPFSLVIFDLDHFKLINDKHGHLMGDTALCEVANLTQNCIRKLDRVARWGGEEFVLLLPGCNRAAAYMAAEKLRKRIESHIFPHGGRVSCSLGVAQYQPAESPESLVARADLALYTSKQQGRNQTTCA